MKVIMISGKSASGKDTFARLLKEDLEKNNKRVLTIHFGDPVKWFAKEYFNWDGNKDSNGRELLQRIGTTMLRGSYPTYWAEMIAKFIHATENEWDVVLIPDLRFENEFETVCEYNENVLAIRIVREHEDGTPYYNPNMRNYQLTHISECELDNFPFEYIIINRGTIDDLQDSADLFEKLEIL